jgi:two-component system OmpR family response regulator
MAGDLTRILYVEDEDDIRTVTVRALKAVGGFTVVACSSGEEALGAAPGAGADMILLDGMMPGMDGPATLAALRNIPATASTPVVFLTAKVQPSEVDQFLRLGAVDVVSKPFDPMALPARLREIWRRCGD